MTPTPEEDETGDTDWAESSPSPTGASSDETIQVESDEAEFG